MSFMNVFLFNLVCPNMCSLNIKLDGSKTKCVEIQWYEGHSIDNANTSNSLMNAYMALKFYQFVP